MNAFSKYFLALILVFSTVLSCRSGEEEIQEIDQVLKIYVDSAGIDMLNGKVPKSYKTITFNDINGTTDNAPVSLNLLKDEDTLNYMQYISGAKRILIDSSDLSRKLYQSKIAIRYAKPSGISFTYVVLDTMQINYSLTPQRFQIDQVIYNNKEVFKKTIPQENTVKISR